MAGQLSSVMIEHLVEYEHSSPDSTFIALVRVFYELSRNRNFVVAYFEKAGSANSFRIMMGKVEELAFEDTDILVLIFKTLYRIIKLDANAADLFDMVGGGIIPKIVDIISAH
jgi:hypothetical protein